MFSMRNSLDCCQWKRSHLSFPELAKPFLFLFSPKLKNNGPTFKENDVLSKSLGNFSPKLLKRFITFLQLTTLQFEIVRFHSLQNYSLQLKSNLFDCLYCFSFKMRKKTWKWKSWGKWNHNSRSRYLEVLPEQSGYRCSGPRGIFPCPGMGLVRGQSHRLRGCTPPYHHSWKRNEG